MAGEMPLTPAEKVQAIEAALDAHPTGVKSVTFDGTTTQWSHDEAIRQLEYWRKRAAAVGRSVFRGTDLSGGQL
jgi:hypothetical protein